MTTELPLAADDFAALMATLEPFETSPALALAVSGGADSMALALLASAWATSRGGKVTALIVDHRLRADSSAEAQITQLRLIERGIPAEILTRSGTTPSADVQAFARDARYDLMTRWCRDRGVLHLITAHHRADQAETLLLRMARGSGLAGLAAMSAIVHLGACRLLRPLLTIPPERLRATLQAAGACWIEDPSNSDEAFARVRLRRNALTLTALGLDPVRLAATARHLGRARAAAEDQVAGLLAASVAIHPAGFATLMLPKILAASPDTALRALAAVVTCIGGQHVTPRFERLEAFRVALGGAGITGRTLSGCRAVRQGDAVLVFREPAAVAPPLPLEAGPVRWDNRFFVSIPSGAARNRGLTIGALGTEHIGALKHMIGERGGDIPARVWPTLPTVRRQGTMVSVPHLAWEAPEAADEIGPFNVVARFSPGRALTECGFTVV